MKSARSYWIFLILGILLRSVALNQPLVDAHLLRQCQTAAATKSMIEQPGFPLTARIPWLGDLDAHFILELPVYNYLVMSVHRLTGNLDLSGKMTSILLWAISFGLLQSIWRRMLDREQTFWANLLFVFAPLEVFYGQAFMPEMLVQMLAFGFVLLAIRYDEAPTLARWVACAAVGLIGLLVKLPEIAHLYLIPVVFIVRRHGWKEVFRPRYLVAAAATLTGMKAWSAYMDSVNMAFLPEWTSKEALRGFIGPLSSRFHLKPWAMVLAYLSAFAVTGPAALAAAYGAWVFVRKQQRLPLLGIWLFSLAVFYVLWFGNAASAQSYYNLPAMAPLCALFGFGMSAVLAWAKTARWRRTAAVMAVLLLLLSSIPVVTYLFKQDRRILDASRWADGHTLPGDVILFRPNHRYDLADYPYNPVAAYYSARPTFVWTRNTPDTYRRLALERARYAIVTMPPPTEPDTWYDVFNRFRGASAPQPESLDWLESAGFRKREAADGFVIFGR